MYIHVYMPCRCVLIREVSHLRGVLYEEFTVVFLRILKADSQNVQV